MTTHQEAPSKAGGGADAKAHAQHLADATLLRSLPVHVEGASDSDPSDAYAQRLADMAALTSLVI